VGCDQNGDEVVDVLDLICYLERNAECDADLDATEIIRLMLYFGELCQDVPDLDCDDLEDNGKSKLGREMTPEERAQLEEECEDEETPIGPPNDDGDNPDGEGNHDDGPVEDEDGCGGGDSGGAKRDEEPFRDTPPSHNEDEHAEKDGPPLGDRHYTVMPVYELDGPRPVRLSDGTKLEGHTELMIKLTGRDFRIAREYTSGYDSEATYMIGAGWTSSLFKYLHISGSPGSETLVLHGTPVHMQLTYASIGGGKWSAGGSTTQYIETSTVSIDGTTFDVWRLAEPGSWELLFYRDGGTNDANTPPELNGLLLQERDVYGNASTYEYTLYGPALSKQARLTTVYLNGTPAGGDAPARIRLRWELSGGSSPIDGMMDGYWVQRFDFSTSVWTTTDFVDYLYKAEIDSPSADLGADTDLVEVIQGQLEDRPTELEKLVAWGNNPF
jgi:hypothetical protein